VKGPFKPEYYRYWLIVYLVNCLIEALICSLLIQPMIGTGMINSEGV
jgi:hypothetical protein